MAFVLLALCSGCSRAPAHTAPIDTKAEVLPGASGKRVAVDQKVALPTRDAGRRNTRISSLLNVPGKMDYGDFVWDEEGVPEGKVWIVVNLGAQTISVFKGAHEIGTAVTLFGADEKPTPTGPFTVLEKHKDHWSNLYDAPMPYTLRLTNDGIAIHGSEVRYGAATHGCIGLPIDFASRLFEMTPRGTDVIILKDAASLLPVQT